MVDEQQIALVYVQHIAHPPPPTILHSPSFTHKSFCFPSQQFTGPTLPSGAHGDPLDLLDPSTSRRLVHAADIAGGARSRGRSAAARMGAGSDDEDDDVAMDEATGRLVVRDLEAMGLAGKKRGRSEDGYNSDDSDFEDIKVCGGCLIISIGMICLFIIHFPPPSKPTPTAYWWCARGMEVHQGCYKCALRSHTSQPWAHEHRRCFCCHTPQHPSKHHCKGGLPFQGEKSRGGRQGQEQGGALCVLEDGQEDAQQACAQANEREQGVVQRGEWCTFGCCKGCQD